MLGKIVEGALGKLPYHLDMQDVNKAQIIGETGNRYSGKYQVMPEDYLDADFESLGPRITEEDVTLSVPKGDFDDYETEKYLLSLIEEEPINENLLLRVLDDLQNLKVIKNYMDPDEVWEVGQDMLDSSDPTIQEIGRFLSDPHTQMLHGQMVTKQR